MWRIYDREIREKIARFASNPGLVVWSRSAERDIASMAGVTSTAVLEGILEHLACDYVVEADHMENGDLAYIFRCFVGPGRLYVKLKFVEFDYGERMRVFSTHIDR